MRLARIYARVFADALYAALNAESPCLYVSESYVMPSQVGTRPTPPPRCQAHCRPRFVSYAETRAMGHWRLTLGWFTCTSCGRTWKDAADLERVPDSRIVIPEDNST